MNINTSFTLRFRTIIASYPFQSEMECRDLAEVSKVCQNLSRADGPELVAAMVYFDVLTSCGTTPDDLSEKIIGDLCKSLKVGQDEWWNEAVGSYDKFTNRVTPANMGTLFPDGTLRVMWDAEESVQSFDDTLSILDNALVLLLGLQGLPTFQPSDEELDGTEGPAAAESRRTDVLFEAGLWPDESGTFQAENPDVGEILRNHST